MQFNAANVAAGSLPAVEGGVLPPGPSPELLRPQPLRTAIPPGGTSGSTAGADAGRYFPTIADSQPL
jgi:hypothetical protein